VKCDERAAISILLTQICLAVFRFAVFNGQNALKRSKARFNGTKKTDQQSVGLRSTLGLPLVSRPALDLWSLATGQSA
jgi:hypothetical protein